MSMDCVEQHEAEDFANTGHGLEQREGMGIVLLGGLQDRELQVPEQRILIGDQGQVDREVLGHGRARQSAQRRPRGWLV